MKKKILLCMIIAGMIFTGCGKANKVQDAGNEQVQDAVETTEVANQDNEADKTETPETTDAEDKEDLGVQVTPGVYQYEYTEELEGDEMYCYNYLVLNDDKSGNWIVQDIVPIKWNDSSITYNDEEYDFTMDGSDLVLNEEFGPCKYIYLPDVTAQEFIDNWENPEYMFGLEGMLHVPNSFVEEAAGVTSFSSYEEVIENLKPGQGYAYINMNGYDGDLLAITDGLYDYGEGKMASMDVVVYAKQDDKVVYVTGAYSSGTAYPISISKEGYLMSGGNHEVAADSFAQDTGSVMMMFSVYETFDENGDATYGGFYREKNILMDDETEWDITPERYQELFDVYLNSDMIVFTVVE